jgi:AraC-like DNA-binding protein
MLLPHRDLADADAVLFWPPVLATWGPGGVSEMHNHHAAQVILALSGSVVLRGTRDSGVDTAGVFAPSGAPHAVDARGSDVLVLFAEPSSDLGQALARRFPGRDARALPDEASAVRALLPPDAQGAQHVAAIREAMPSLLKALGAPLVPPSAVHPGIRKVLRHLESVPLATNTTLEHLATIAGLSPGRFMHAFTQSVGSPLRHYLLWQKLGRAAAALAAGRSPSAAAMQAGFADAAHCTRTFRRMFGVTPTAARPPDSTSARP